MTPKFRKTPQAATAQVCRRRLRMAVPVILAFLGSLVAAGATSAAPAYPVKVGPTGRYLVDQNGVPFLMAGDSPQAMIGNLSEADAALFLANRKGHGFNTVWINLLCASYTACNADGSTFDGIRPFTIGTDLSTYDLSAPNEAYFERADRILQLAAQYGFLVILDPIETGSWLRVLQINGLAKARTYGQYLGQRYASFDNIVWMHGNDFQSWRIQTDDALVQEVAGGIRESDSRHLHTVELDFFVSSSLDDPSWAPFIQLNASYTYFPTYAQVLLDYNRRNFLPVFMVEAGYEGENNCGDPCGVGFGTPRVLRSQEYWSNLSGATGQLFGNTFSWQLTGAWKDALDTPGAIQMAYVTALFESRAWYDLVPDQTLITAGFGTFGLDDYVTAARTPDGALAMAYVPTARTVTVDMSMLSGPVTARWYDPAAGTFTNITGSPFTNAGSRDFQTPGNNADGLGNEDWVLVLEVASARAVLTNPGPGSILSGATATLSWSTGAGATQYWLTIGTTGVGSNDVYGGSQGTSLSGTVSGLPTNGSPVYVRLWTLLGGTTWQFNDYAYTAVTQSKAVLTSPAPGSTLAGATVTFSWDAGGGATQYWLTIGTTGVGSNDVYGGSQGASLSGTVSGLPPNGSPVYVRLWTLLGGTTWQFNDYTYTAAAQSKAVLTSPAPGSTLAGSTVTFSWDAGGGATQYWLTIGTTGVGSNDVYGGSQGVNLSRTVSGLPTNGSPVYVRLWSLLGGTSWQFNDYTYTAP